MESEERRETRWLWALLLLLLVLAALAVPVGGALRDSSARGLIAAGILVVGAGVGLLLFGLTRAHRS